MVSTLFWFPFVAKERKLSLTLIIFSIFTRKKITWKFKLIKNCFPTNQIGTTKGEVKATSLGGGLWVGVKSFRVKLNRVKCYKEPINPPSNYLLIRKTWSLKFEFRSWMHLWSKDRSYLPLHLRSDNLSTKSVKGRKNKTQKQKNYKTQSNGKWEKKDVNYEMIRDGRYQKKRKPLCWLFRLN